MNYILICNILVLCQSIPSPSNIPSNIRYTSFPTSEYTIKPSINNTHENLTNLIQNKNNSVLVTIKNNTKILNITKNITQLPNITKNIHQLSNITKNITQLPNITQIKIKSNTKFYIKMIITLIISYGIIKFIHTLYIINKKKEKKEKEYDIPLYINQVSKNKLNENCYRRSLSSNDLNI